MTAHLHALRSTAAAALLALAAACAPPAAPPAPAPEVAPAPEAAPAPDPAPAPQPAPDPADVASIDAIVSALYESISGPVGAPRDWDRLRSLFHPSARLTATGTAQDGTPVMIVMTPEDYIERSGEALVAMGFVEREVGRTTDHWGRIAQLFSSYESYRGTEDEPFMRGINSIQLWQDADRWWVLSVFWQQESPEHPIPDRYLEGERR